jgi:hypothetical protein
MNSACLSPLLPLVLAACCALESAREAAAEDLAGEWKSLKTHYVVDLQQLAAWCEEHNLAAEAKKTRSVSGPSDPYKLYLPVLPKEVGPAKPPADAAQEVADWHAKLAKLRHDQAAALYDLARRAVRQHEPSLAYMLVLAAIRENPDHEGARRVLGYQKFRNQWHTAYEVRKLRSGQMWSDKFGWLTKSALDRYERGQRPAGTRWVSAEDDARAHHDIKTPWEVETEHYLIRTDHSIEAGVAIGQKLETLCRLWQQMFLRYYASETYVDALFNGRGQPVRRDVPRLRIVYFRDHDDYRRNLKDHIANLGESAGVYYQPDRTAYFYAGGEYHERVLNHEATHQLFQEARPTPAVVGRDANFWVVEGIALFMETLHDEDGFHVLGGLDDVRMQAARQHLENGDYFVPFERVTAYGMEQLQTDPKVASLYSQMAAMANFLVFDDNGRYRDALVAYLSAVYSTQDSPGTLAHLTGTSYERLDQQYKEFMKLRGK